MITYRDRGFELALLTNGRHFPRHSHDEFVISANLHGLEQVWLDGDTFVADTRMVTTYNPGQLQGSEHSHDRWQCVSLYVQPQALEAAFHHRFLFARPYCLDDTLARRLAWLANADLTREERWQQMVLLLAALMDSEAPTPGAPARHEPARIRRIKSWLTDDFSEVPSLAEMSALERISAAHLVRSFTQAVGIPPLAWLMQERMRQARRRLRQGERISQVAVTLGFADQAHFTKAFSRYNAMTPGQFRRINF
ncbi:helix-turn-helix transcriptional regulator [Musicola keenii]|uniref:helix-turn-helix transcriptional regulator n=1 Tax=Musicola keenii TaxID=2884250 RepID=UPI00177D66F8|nr:AraC family transcriptional regulator [Musicola keenii]